MTHACNDAEKNYGDDAAERALPNPEYEALAAKFRFASRGGDDGPEGTRESLERCAKMLDTYAPDLFPANDKGQVHFARAMMESVADEIRAYLSQGAGEAGKS
jgi:hypothetical protein